MEIEKDTRNKKIIEISIVVIIFLALIIWITGYVSLNKKVNEKKSLLEGKEIAKNEPIEEELKNEISSKVSQILNLGYQVDDNQIPQDNENIPYSNVYEEQEEKNFFSNSALRLKNMLENKEVTTEEKNYIALKQVRPTKITIKTQNIKNETIKKAVMQDEELGIKTDILQIEEKEVEEKYEALFDTKMKHKTIIGCPGFYYDKQNKVYYYMERCGKNPLTNTYLSIYKDNYNKKGNEVTVEVTIAYIEEITEYASKEREKLAGFYISKDSNFTKEIKQEIGTEFKIDEKNKKDFDTYKFVFKKDEDYYRFESIKRVINY